MPRSTSSPARDGNSATYDTPEIETIEGLTARNLTVGETLPDRVGPGTLDGRIVLVHGGAGAVGNATIQLARWAGATVSWTRATAEER